MIIDHAKAALTEKFIKELHLILKSGASEDGLKLNNSALDEVGGDIIGHIYEYFLNKFAKNIASDDGVFFTPKSLVKMIVNIIEPRIPRIHFAWFSPVRCGSPDLM